MSSILSSQGMVLATAMAAVSGTVILLAFRLQKSYPPSQFSIMVNSLHPPGQSPQPLPRSCISSVSSPSDGKKKDKKKKRVHFAADVVDPTGNSDEYRKKLRLQQKHSSSSHNGAADSLSSSSSSSSSSTTFNGGKVQGMPANRVALYNGILRDRTLHRTTYSY